jgi:micrococcal nuclease
LLILLGALVLFLEFIIDRGGDAQGVQLPRVEPTPVVETPDGSLLAEVNVLRVIDDDTIEVEADGRRVEVRYKGSHPDEPCEAEATERNRELVEGKTVFLLDETTDEDREGYLLRYVFTIDGHLVDETLIREGLARAWVTDGGYQDELLALEDRVRTRGTGCLWED